MSRGGDPTGADGPHAFVADLDDPALTDDDLHHLTRVVRLRPGDRLTIGDGAGRWRAAALGSAGRLEVVSDVVEVARPAPPVTVAFALVKGDRPELIVQKLTEVGVDVVVPFVADRSVVRWDAERARRHHQRLVRVAREASMQCRRAWLPEVEPLSGFAALAGRPGVARAEREGTPVSLDRPVVLIGPEGGWSDAERDLVADEVALGPHVLRAETAAIVAGALLVSLRTGVVARATGGD